MTEPGSRYDFVYVHTDIPEGMTIREWREQRAVERQAMFTAARERRRERRVEAIRRWLAAAPLAVRRPRFSRHEASG
jgi:hypothetical protein